MHLPSIKQIGTFLTDDIRNMSMREHLGYWIVPAAVLALLISFYFSSIPALVTIVCPQENWEWGMLENIQLLILLTILGITIFAAVKKKSMLQRLGFSFLTFFTLFVFLEEIDYGAHLQHYISGSKDSLLGEYYNVHNQGNNAKIFKRSVYGIMTLIFVIAPFLSQYIKNPILQYLIPKPKIFIIAVLAIAADLIPRLLVNFKVFEDGGLGVNIGEFSEIVVYQIFLVYLIQLVFEKEWPGITQSKRNP